jgi:hypothetical protein
VALPDFQLAAVSSGGRYFAIATADGAVEIREGASGALAARIASGVPAAVTALAVSEDGGAALIASATTLSLWTSDRDGAMRNVWSGDGIRSVTFLGDTRDYAALDGGKYLVSRGGALTENPAPVAGASALASIETGAKLAIGGDRLIAIVDPGAGDSTVRLAVDGTVEGFAKVNGGGEVLQILLRGDGRTALLETSGQAQIEMVVAGGGIR